MSPNTAIAKVYIGTRSYLVKELNASNYLQWCNTMKAILKSEDLLSYLQDPTKKDSRYPAPDPEAIPAVTPKSIEKNDDAIAIFLATAEEFRKFIDLDNKAYQAWKNLEDYFLSQSSNNVNRLEEELQAIVLDNCMNMADYTNKKLEKCLELAAAKEDWANTDRYKVKAIMAGLRGHPQYGHCSVMFEDVHHSLHKFLGQLNDTYASMPSTPKEGALYTRPNIVCFKCNRQGHIQRDCPQGQPTPQTTPQWDPKNCSWCRKPGHKIQDCRIFKSTGQILRRKQEDFPDHTGHLAYEHALTIRDTHTSVASSSDSFAFKTTNTPNHPNDKHSTSHPGPQFWTVDSGASSHMTNCLQDFSEYTPLHHPITIHTADTQVQLKATAIGTVQLGMNQPALTKTLFVPGLSHKLFSLSKILDKGYRTEFSPSHFYVLDSSNNQILTGMRHGDLYYIQQHNDTNHANTATTPTKTTSKSTKPPQAETAKPIPTQTISRTMQEWHEALGHISKDAIIRTSKAVTGMIITDTDLPFCEACALSKAKKVPFPQPASTTKPSIIGDILVGDYQGPFTQKSLGGATGISTYIDTTSGYAFCLAVQSKASVFEHFVTINERYKTQHGRSIRILRTDNGGEYKNSSFAQYCRDNGIIHQFTNPHTPEQNKRAEKHNQIFYEKLLATLNSSHLNRALSAEVLQTIVHVHNRTVRTGQTLTPYELWTGEQPNLSHLHPIGTPTFVLIPKANQQKLVTNKATKGVLVGFGEDIGTKGYRILTANNKIISSRHVVFQTNNTKPPNLSYTEPIQNTTKDFLLSDELYSNELSTHPPVTTEESNKSTTIELHDHVAHIPDTPTKQMEITHAHVHDQSNNGTPQSPGSPLQDHRFMKELESHLGKAFDPINETRRPRASIAHANVAFSANRYIDTPEPSTYAEAMNGPESSQWQESIDQEFQSWIKNGVAEIIDQKDLPPDAKLIHGRPVFKRKLNALGEVARYKCRGVAKGYTQRPGIDFYECESPVIRQCSVRTLLSIAATHDLELHHGDVDTAFLVPTLKEALYLHPIEGMSIPKGKVLKLLKCIYGLKQASREWYMHFVSILESLGFTPTISDPCILTKTIEGQQYYIGIYVDDFIVTGKDTSVIQDIFTTLEKHLNIKRLGHLSWILGMRISRDRLNKLIFLDQTAYINNLARKFQLQDANATTTPHTDLSEPSTTPADSTLYQSIVGSLQHASVCTRPDITFTTCKLSRYLKDPTETHLKAAISVVKYLKTTKNAKLALGGTDLTMIAYADAAYADNLEDRKSTSGQIIMVGSGPIIWQSKKQPIIALSTTEAEYIAATTAITDIMWLQNLLQELGLLKGEPTTLYQDNRSTMLQISKSVIHSRTRHLDVRYHFIKEQVRLNTIQIQHLPTAQMLADIFTKGLPKSQHMYLRTQIGVLTNVDQGEVMQNDPNVIVNEVPKNTQY
jgi:hypothetical protein